MPPPLEGRKRDSVAHGTGQVTSQSVDGPVLAAEVSTPFDTFLSAPIKVQVVLRLNGASGHQSGAGSGHHKNKKHHRRKHKKHH